MEHLQLYGLLLLITILLLVFIYFQKHKVIFNSELPKTSIESFISPQQNIQNMFKDTNTPVLSNTIHNSSQQNNPTIPNIQIKFKIPAIIHQTLKSKDNLDRVLTRNIDSWKNKNPDFEHRLYDDKDCELFIAKYFTPKHVQTFHAIKAGAGKADFFRYCVLYINGGFYSDVDMRCLEPLYTWVQPGDTFVIPKDCDNECVDLFQAFIGSTPKNPILLRSIEKVIFQVEKRYFCRNLLKLSGPNMIGKVMNHYLGRKRLSVFEEGEIDHQNQQIRIISHNIKNPKEYIMCGGKKVIKAQTWFRRKKTNMNHYGKQTWYC